MAALPLPARYVGCGMWDGVCCMVAGDHGIGEEGGGVGGGGGGGRGI